MKNGRLEGLYSLIKMEFGTSCGAVKFMFVHVIAKEKIRERVGLVYLAMLLRCVRLTCKHYLVQKS